MAQHPTEETLNITRKFLGGELGTPGQPPDGRGQSPSILPRQQTRLPSQAAPIAGQRAFGQQGQRRRQAGASVVPPSAAGRLPLSDRFFDLPGPVDFARTSQGQAILQRILGRGRGFR